MNEFPLTLGPHGSNCSDVVGALKSLTTDPGVIIVDINGEKVLCAIQKQGTKMYTSAN